MPFYQTQSFLPITDGFKIFMADIRNAVDVHYTNIDCLFCSDDRTDYKISLGLYTVGHFIVLREAKRPVGVQYQFKSIRSTRLIEDTRRFCETKRMPAGFQRYFFGGIITKKQLKPVGKWKKNGSWTLTCKKRRENVIKKSLIEARKDGDIFFG